MATFTNDELILTLISLVRAIDPKMLQQGPDGFSVDMSPLEKKATLTPDENLLIKLRAAFNEATPGGHYEIALDGAESSRLASTLETLEKMQKWPEDVLALSQGVRARLAGKS